MEFLSVASTIEMIEIATEIQGLLIDADDCIYPSNLYEAEKVEILKRIFNGHNLVEIEQFEKLINLNKTQNGAKEKE